MKRLFQSKAANTTSSSTPQPMPSFHSLTGQPPPPTDNRGQPLLSTTRQPLISSGQTTPTDSQDHDRYSQSSPPTGANGNSNGAVAPPKKGLFGFGGGAKSRGAGGQAEEPVVGEQDVSSGRSRTNGNGAGMGPPRIDNVAGVIGWSCAASTLDYSYVLALCDHISLSASAAKDGAKALRKELKYATPLAQERAVRLMGIMMRNTDTRFRQQIASKQFLSQLSEVHRDKKTDPAVVNMINRVLAPLAYDYQYDSELSAITALWNKLKPIDAPHNGAPLDPEDSLFTPTSDPRRAPVRYERPRDLIPSATEQLQSLEREAKAAKGNAAMLSEAVAFTPAEELEGNELVAEFYANCVTSQETIESNLAWATVQAEQSRLALPVIPLAPPPSTPPLVSLSPTPQFSSNNPFAGIVSLPPAVPAITSTAEEDLLALLLSAHSDLQESLSLYASHSKSSQDASELSAIQTLSLSETKFDRAKAGVPDEEGNYMSPPPTRSGVSSSSTSFVDRHDESEAGQMSPPPSIVQGKGKGKGREESTMPLQRLNTSTNPYAAYLTPPTPTKSSPPIGLEGEEEGEEEEFQVRSSPSAKALGKLRSVSTRTEVDEEEQQRRLEEQLREKYSRNYEEDQGRRSAEIRRE